MQKWKEETQNEKKRNHKVERDWKTKKKEKCEICVREILIKYIKKTELYCAKVNNILG